MKTPQIHGSISEPTIDQTRPKTLFTLIDEVENLRRLFQETEDEEGTEITWRVEAVPGGYHLVAYEDDGYKVGIF